MTGPDETLTTHEVAEILQVPIETVRLWIRRGEFPNAFVELAETAIRIPQSDVDAFRGRGLPEER